MSDSEPLTEDEFRRLCEFLYRQTGLIFTEAKRYYVARRVAERIRATGVATFASYFAHLRADLDHEIESFINAFTVNETYFYREEHQLRCLSSDLLNRRTVGKPAGAPLRIWSIPCSTGEEPYSIAMWLLENWAQVDTYDIEIIGSDIDTDVVEAAKQGVYGRRALMRLAPDLVHKYFETLDEERWRIIPDMRQSVQFTTANVLQAAETRPHGRFDIVFCRNVLIYFDDTARRVAAENLYESLLPGGYVCLGHTELMSRISSLFEVCRFDDAIVYQRPREGFGG